MKINQKNLNYFDAVIFARTSCELDMDAAQKQDLVSSLKEDGTVLVAKGSSTGWIMKAVSEE